MSLLSRSQWQCREGLGSSGPSLGLQTLGLHPRSALLGSSLFCPLLVDFQEGLLVEYGVKALEQTCSLGEELPEGESPHPQPQWHLSVMRKGFLPRGMSLLRRFPLSGEFLRSGETTGEKEQSR